MPDEVVSESLIKVQDPASEATATPAPPAVMDIQIEPPLILDLTRRKTNLSTKVLITVNKNTRVRVNGVEL